MSKLTAIGEALLFLLLACVLALFGVGIPIHFRAIAPGVLVEAGRGTETLEELAALYLDAGKTGPYMLLRPQLKEVKGSGRRLQDLLQKYPAYAISGGPAPYFEQFLGILGENRAPAQASDVISFLLPAHRRSELLGFLEHSSNAAVQSILETRSLTGYVRFMPVNTPAGQPLDATILMAALAAQGNRFTPEVAREIKLLAENAVQGDRSSAERLERVYLTLLSFGKRLNWLQLTEFTPQFSDLQTMENAAVLIRQSPERLSLFYTLALLGRNPGGLIAYLGRFEEDGWKNLAFALSAGQGAIRELTEQMEPLYQPPALVQMIDRPISWIRQAPLLSFTHQHPQAAINLKIVAFLAAGYALALVLNDLREATLRRRRLSGLHPAIVFENSFVALFAALTLWVLMEPALFESGPEPESQLRLDFNIANNLQSLKSQNIETAMLDQITILIILLFFLLQFVVYAFCLIKIAELKKQEEDSALKIKLLENEENLFDLGLYVGLGGTVASLILLAMDIVQASLIAAYSSTLFGIIFVAVLKVLHVRPYRRKLILEVEKNQS